MQITPQSRSWMRSRFYFIFYSCAIYDVPLGPPVPMKLYIRCSWRLHNITSTFRLKNHLKLSFCKHIGFAKRDYFNFLTHIAVVREYSTHKHFTDTKRRWYARSYFTRADIVFKSNSYFAHVIKLICYIFRLFVDQWWSKIKVYTCNHYSLYRKVAWTQPQTVILVIVTYTQSIINE